MFIVSGATGNTGRIVAETLLSRGKQVTVLVRDRSKGQSWVERGAKAAVASLEDSKAFAGVLSGAEGFYANIPPMAEAKEFTESRARLIDAVAQAIQTSGVSHTVLLSSIAAHLPNGTGPIGGLHYAEGVFRMATRNLTSLRATFFMTNWIPSMDRTNGVLHNFLTPERKISQIAAKDIGRFAAEALIAGPAGHLIQEVAGPRDYSPEDIARMVGLKLQTYPIDAVVPALTARGLSEEYARLAREMFEGLNAGRIVFEFGSINRGTVTAEEALQATAASARS